MNEKPTLKRAHAQVSHLHTFVRFATRVVYRFNIECRPHNRRRVIVMHIKRAVALRAKTAAVATVTLHSAHSVKPYEFCRLRCNRTACLSTLSMLASPSVASDCEHAKTGQANTPCTANKRTYIRKAILHGVCDVIYLIKPRRAGTRTRC